MSLRLELHGEEWCAIFRHLTSRVSGRFFNGCICQGKSKKKGLVGNLSLEKATLDMGHGFL